MTSSAPATPLADPPRPAKRPRWKLVAIIGGIAVALAIIGSFLPDQPTTPAAAETTRPGGTNTTTASARVDQAELDAWWAGGSVPASVRASTTKVSWSGVALVAETRLTNDQDAARGVCAALSAFGLTHGGFLPVQVVGADGGLLVSRHAESEQCTWRG